VTNEVSPYLLRRLRSLSEVLGPKAPAVRASSPRDGLGTTDTAPVRKARVAGIAADRNLSPNGPRLASGRAGD
jgi:hypothetical protein